MKAVVIEKPGQVVLKDVEIPEPPKGFARIKVMAAAICATDLEIVDGNIPANYPLTPGHEWSGIVDSVGDEADSHWVGKSVVGSNDVICRKCEACMSGNWRYCPSFEEIGFKRNGAYAEYVIVPVYGLVEKAENISFEHAALCEPLGVALGTFKKAKAKAGDTLMIMGAGSIGLSLLAVGKAMGMQKIVVCATTDARLKTAREMGAYKTIATREEDLEATMEKYHPGGTDVVIDATGIEECIGSCLRIAKRGGTVLLAGYGRGKNMSIRMDDIHVKNLKVIGAGKTGRGFIGRLIAEDNTEFAFVEKDAGLVEELNKAPFKVSFFGNSREPMTVSGYKAYTWDNADFSDTELIFVSVCGGNLADVGAELKKRLSSKKTYYIITCENYSNPAGKLKEAIGMDNVFVSEATVFCTTIDDKGLDISSENYPYLQCNADLLGGFVPYVKAVKPVKEFGNFLTRKLFTYNAASCIIAYLGWLQGYEDYASAANDEKILELLDKNYEITNRVLCKEFGYDEKDQAEFALLSRNKFTDKTIADTVSRNAREPQRKLGKAERIIGPMLVIDKYGEDTSILVKTAAAMLLYDNDGEDAWRKIKNENTPGEILENICGLSKGSNLYNKILTAYEEIKQ